MRELAMYFPDAATRVGVASSSWPIERAKKMGACYVLYFSLAAKLRFCQETCVTPPHVMIKARAHDQGKSSSGI